MTTIRVHPDMTITADKYKLGVRGDRGFEKFTIIAPEEHEGVDLSSLTGKLRYQLSDNRINTMYMGTPSNSDGVLTYSDFENLPENAESYPGMFSVDQWIYVSISWEHSDGSLYKSTVPNNNFQIINSIALDGELAAQNPDSILDLRNSKLDKDGDGKDVTVTFSPAEEDTNIESGSKLSKLFRIIYNHIASKLNPHEVTKAQVGLSNVDNTSDLNKPISTATQTALNNKLPLTPYKNQLDNMPKLEHIPTIPPIHGFDLLQLDDGMYMIEKGYMYGSPENESELIDTGPYYLEVVDLGGGDKTRTLYDYSTGNEWVAYMSNVWVLKTAGTNTGDETAESIKSKLGITVLSGNNTGDQDLSTKPDYDKTTGKLQGAYTPYITYQHPRGDAEMAGNAEYGYTTQCVVGFYDTFESDVVFNKMVCGVYATTTTASMEWKLFIRNNADVFNPSSETPIASGTLSAAECAHVSTEKTSIVLTSPIFVPVGKYLFALFRAVEGATRMRRWSIDDVNPVRHPLLYGTMQSWNFTLIKGLAGYYQSSIKLFFENEELKAYSPLSHISDASIPDSKMQNPKASYNPLTGEVNGAFVPFVTYKHPRGDAEMVGDGTYVYQTGNIVGFYEQITMDTVFNKFEGYVFADDASASLEWKIYLRSSAAAFNPSTVTPIASGTLSDVEGSHSSSVASKIVLSSPILVAKNQYLFVLFRATSGGTSIKKWRSNTTGPERHGFVLTTNGWNANTAISTATTTCQTAMKLYLESEELKNYTPPSSILNPIYALINSRTVPRIILPDEIVAVVGERLQLFVRGMIEAQNPYNAPYDISCTVGNAYPRFWEYTPVSGDVGTKVLTVNVRDTEGTSIVSKSCNIIVKNPSGQPSSQKNVLCVGDSLTAGMAWPQEMYRRLCQTGGSFVGLGYGNIKFIGNTAFANYATQKGVGYGGWNWGSYTNDTPIKAYWVTCTHDKDVTDQKSIYKDINNNQWRAETIESGRIKFVAYSHISDIPASGSLVWVRGGAHHSTINYASALLEPGTPFWNSSTGLMSFSSFMSNNGYSGLNIDACYVLLGWNNLPLPNAYLPENHATQIGYAKTFINQLHTDYPDAQIRVMGIQVPSPIGGLGANYSANSKYSNYYSLLRTVNGLNLAYQDLVNETAYSSFCKYIAIAPQFDSEYNMPFASQPVNSRSTVTENRGSNGIHPSVDGYYQIADAAYRDFIRTFCS